MNHLVWTQSGLVLWAPPQEGRREQGSPTRSQTQCWALIGLQCWMGANLGTFLCDLEEATSPPWDSASSVRPMFLSIHLPSGSEDWRKTLASGTS